MTSPAPKFIVDPDLYPLCHALRILGFDALYSGNLALEQALHQAIEEHRLWVGQDSDRFKLQYGIRYFLVSSSELSGQLKELAEAFHLRDSLEPLSLCLKCNVRIIELSADQAQSQVPEGIFQIHQEFYECPRCRRIYWPGSHWQKMKQRIADWGF